MTERESTAPPTRLAVLAAALLATLALLVAGSTVVVTASVSANCPGTGGGAAFVADSNFTVYYNDTEPMPASGVFLNDSAVEFRNVTLVANGTASLRLENGTGEVTCYGDVDATATPITIAPADGGTTLDVDGAVDSLSVGPATVDTGNATLAYEAPSAWNATIALGEPDGTDLQAEDAAGSVLANGTVDGGSLSLTLPAGSHAVVLASAPGPGGNGTTTPTATATPTTRARSGGGGGGGGGSTRTATATPLPTSTATAEPTRTPTATPEPTPTATVAVASTDEPTEGPAVEQGGGSLPLLEVLLAAVAVIGAAGAGLVWRRRG